MPGRKHLFILVLFSIAIPLEAQVYNAKNNSLEASVVRKYIYAQNSRKQKYFYVLYCNHSFQTLTEKDSTLIHKVMSHPNEFQDQHSHFFNDFEGIRNLNQREDSLVIYGYPMQRVALIAARDWKSESYNDRFIPVHPWLSTNRYRYQSAYWTNTPRVAMYNYAVSSQRYQYMSEIRKRERSER